MLWPRECTIPVNCMINCSRLDGNDVNAGKCSNNGNNGDDRDISNSIGSHAIASVGAPFTVTGYGGNDDNRVDNDGINSDGDGNDDNLRLSSLCVVDVAVVTVVSSVDADGEAAKGSADICTGDDEDDDAS